MSVGTRIAEGLVAEARTWVDTPWFHAGRVKGVAGDCVGVILCPAWKLGLTLYHPAPYGPDFDRELLVQCVGECMNRVDIPWATEDYYAVGLPKALAGDVILFAVRGHPAHLAYATGEGTMIHCEARARKVVETDISAHWAKQMVSVWRWPACALGGG